MKYFLQYILGLFLSLSALYAFLTGWGHIWFDISSDRPAAYSARQSKAVSLLPKYTKSEKEQELASAKHATEVVFPGPQSHSQLARILQRQASEEKDEKARIELYCQALGAWGEAVRRRPQNAKALVSWANVAQLLGESRSCPQPYTKGNFRQAIALALQNDPTNADVMFSAGLLYLWDGERSRARELFRQVLSLDMSVAPEQETFILSQIADEDDIAGIIPGRFPQIVRWTKRFQTERPAQYKDWSGTFAKLQSAAVIESVSNYEDGTLPMEIHQKRLVDLLEVVSSAQVRREVDAELAPLFMRSGNPRLAQYLNERKVLDELPIVRARITSDTRPLKNSLIGWSQDPVLHFDEFYQSIGFYLAQGAQLKLIELSGLANKDLGLQSYLRVFVSNDNYVWTEVGGQDSIVSYRIGDNLIYAIKLPSGDSKYFKLNFNSAQRSNTFANQLSRMLKSYGISPVKEAA